jgi:hypothetical protein
LRFVIKESGGRDRWFDNYGADFVVPLPEQAVSTSLNGNVRNNSQTATASPTKNGPKSMEAAQMALGGAAAATFSGIKSNIDASIEEAIKEAAIAMEAAKIAREVAEQATAAAKDLPEDAGASTKARRLIAQANATAERAAITARRAEAAAIRAKAAKDASFSDLTSTAAAANLIKKAEEVEKMAEETWAGADVEISEDTLKRWRDEMELAVTKEAEARAAEAEAAARELLEQRKVEAEQERIEAQAAIESAAAAAEAKAAAEARAAEAKAAAEASVAKLEAEQAEAAKVAADAQAQAEAALEAEIEQSIQDNMSAAVEEGNSKLAEIERELKERMDALEEMKRAAADPTIERSTDKPSWLVDPEATIVMPDPVEISEPPRTFAEPVTPPVSSSVVPRSPGGAHTGDAPRGPVHADPDPDGHRRGDAPPGLQLGVLPHRGWRRVVPQDDGDGAADGGDGHHRRVATPANRLGVPGRVHAPGLVQPQLQVRNQGGAQDVHRGLAQTRHQVPRRRGVEPQVRSVPRPRRALEPVRRQARLGRSGHRERRPAFRRPG